MIVCRKYHFLIVYVILCVDCVNKCHIRSSNCTAEVYIYNAILVTEIINIDIQQSVYTLVNGNI